MIFDYYSQANEEIECNHKQIVDAFLKIFVNGFINWIQNLSLISYANCLNVSR